MKNYISIFIILLISLPYNISISYASSYMWSLYETKTQLLIEGPKETYINYPTIYQIYLLNEDNEVINISIGDCISIYINDTLYDTLDLSNGYASFELLPRSEDILSLKVYFKGGFYNGVKYGESTAFLHVRVRKRPVKILFAVEVFFGKTNSTHVEATFDIRVYDALTNKSVDNGFVRLYFFINDRMTGENVLCFVDKFSLTNGRVKVHGLFTCKAEIRDIRYNILQEYMKIHNITLKYITQYFVGYNDPQCIYVSEPDINSYSDMGIAWPWKVPSDLPKIYSMREIVCYVAPLNEFFLSPIIVFLLFFFSILWKSRFKNR